jgi:hypothetical protein
MTEPEKIDRLRAGIRQLDEQNRDYLRDITHQLVFLQYLAPTPTAQKAAGTDHLRRNMQPQS